jgi:membrane protease YdiL (CAAX protease family)
MSLDRCLVRCGGAREPPSPTSPRSRRPGSDRAGLADGGAGRADHAAPAADYGALLAGLLLAPKVGLDAPILSGRLRLEPQSAPRLRALVTAAVIVAIVCAGLLYGYEQSLSGLMAGLNGEARATLEAFQPPLVTRVLYGGLAEEIITRWGLMTFFVWLISRVARQQGGASARVYWVGAALAAFLFALGHLPLLFALLEVPPTTLTVTVVGLNTIIGLGFGWLFARHGLEAAMLSHALTHLIAAGLSGLLT